VPRAWDDEFASYFAVHAAPLRRTAYLLAGNWHDAEDLVQATFVRLFAVWPRVRTGSADAYVRRILINVYLSSRRARRSWELPVAELPDGPVPAGEPADDRLAMATALGCLAPGQRAAVVLRYWYGMSVAEAAEALGVSEGTVKRQTFRALAALRQQLTEAVAPAEET
jgi:RNA polymerase sigma-70 factor (sigma-E family)